MERRGEAVAVDAGGVFFAVSPNRVTNGPPIAPRRTIASAPAQSAGAGWRIRIRRG